MVLRKVDVREEGDHPNDGQSGGLRVGVGFGLRVEAEDLHRALCIGLPQGPRRELFLMSEVPM